MSEGRLRLPAGAEDLYALPLADFTARRNALAKDLKAEGDAEGAAVVASLKKPKQSAWVINQLSRRESAHVEDLLQTAERMSDAGGRDAIREATAARHDLVRRLMKRAEALLSEGGRNPSATTLEEVRRTLYAAVDDDDRELLRRGILTEPIEASGFGSEWSLEEDPATEPEPSAADRKRQRELEKLETDLARAEDEANSAAAAADRARRALRDAEEAETKARERVDRIREGIERLA